MTYPMMSPAARRAAMDSIVIDNPRARLAHEKFDYLVELGELRPGLPKRCVSLIAPAQSGKTTIIESYVERLNTEEALAVGEIPALTVTLGANTTRRQFARDILRAFERHGYNALVDTGTEAQLLSRAMQYMIDRKVKVLFLDEFHHLCHSDNKKVVNSVSETVKCLLIEGSCPIVVAGLEDARRPFDDNPQLAHRAEPHLDLKPLDLTSARDGDIYWDFLADYFLKAEQIGAADGLRNMLEGDIPACIFEVSGGVLGAACNLVKEAVQVASHAGRMHVTRDDFLHATDNAILNGLYSRNPFLEGLAPIRAKRPSP